MNGAAFTSTVAVAGAVIGSRAAALAAAGATVSQAEPAASALASALAGAAITAPQALIGFGQVRHTRLRPAHHAFAYPTYFFMLPMRSLRAQPSHALARNRWALLSFYDRDHGDGRADALAWLEELLASEGITDAQGEVWLHCYPRVLGYTFKPVSFWYCHHLDGSLRAVVVEVNNTFGERHCYLLDAPPGDSTSAPGAAPALHYGQELHASKVFHVSPFCSVQGSYRFRFMRTQTPAGQEDRTVVRIDYDTAEGPLLQTSVSGQLEPLTRSSGARALLKHPLMTLMVMARIHWQALRLALKRVPFFSKPAAPQAFVTR